MISYFKDVLQNFQLKRVGASPIDTLVTPVHDAHKVFEEVSTQNSVLLELNCVWIKTATREGDWEPLKFLQENKTNIPNTT